MEKGKIYRNVVRTDILFTKLVKIAMSFIISFQLLSLLRRSGEPMVVGPNVVGFTPPPMVGRLHSLTTPPGVPSPSPPPSVPGSVVQPGENKMYSRIYQPC